MNTKKLNNESAETTTVEILCNVLLRRLSGLKSRGAWDKGVKLYAMEMIEGVQWDVEHYHTVDLGDMLNPCRLARVLLNGAESWSQYSWGGCSLIYDSDICKAAFSSLYHQEKEGWRIKTKQSRRMAGRTGKSAVSSSMVDQEGIEPTSNENITSSSKSSGRL